MEVRVLGAVEVVDDRGGVHTVTSRNQRIVLSVLATCAGQTIGADRLIDAVWGDAPPASAASSLRTYVSRLRAVLGDELVIRPGGYALRSEVDIAVVERLFTSPRTGGGGRDVPVTADALHELDAALGLWRGTPFTGLEDVHELHGPRARLVELHHLLRARRAEALLVVGRAAEAAADAEALLADDPWREHVWEVLVDALTADGRSAEALRAAHRARSTLGEAGLDPGAGLRAAEARALAVEAPPTTVSAHPGVSMPSAAPRSARIPHPPTELVGRTTDVAEVADLLERCRIVTLLGPGGVGKTRLAVEVARRREHRHERGSRLVALDAVTDPTDVRRAVIDALGLGMDGSSVDEQIATAGDLDLLIVVDNCEHVIDAAADVAHALVIGGGRLRIVATSRERLGVPGEHVHEIRPLDVTTAGRELLVERARSVRPDVALGAPDVLDRIVTRLDGLPLAIEMAASQLATCSVEELADRLEGHLSDLTGDRRGVPRRHQSMAELVDWTTEGLPEPDRDLFAELAIFPGEIDADAAVTVTGRPDAPDGMRRLAARSLLSVDDDGTTTRFRMLAPVRACAIEQLGRAGRLDDIAAAHARHVLCAAHAADADIRTDRQATAMAWLDRMVPDLRSAFRWNIDRHPSGAVDLCSALHLYAQAAVRMEIWGWADELVRRDDRAPVFADSDPDQAAIVMATAAHAAAFTGDLDRGEQLADRALGTAATEAGRWAAQEVASDIALFHGRLVDAARLVGALDDLPDDPHAAVVRVIGHLLPAAYAADRRPVDRILGVAMRLPAASGTDRAWIAYGEGEVRRDDDPEAAIGAYERAIDLADAVGDRYVGSMVRLSLCALSARQGSLDVATRGFLEAIDHWRRHNATVHLVTTLRNLPALLRRLDRPVATAELLAGLDALDVRPPWGDERERLLVARTWTDERLDGEQLRHAAAIAADRSLDEVACAARDALR